MVAKCATVARCAAMETMSRMSRRWRRMPRGTTPLDETAKK
jgi:hypothetical protein